MSFLNKTGLQHLTNKLVQGDAIKVVSPLGNTVSKVLENIERECDNVSNPLEYKIENNALNFKIGKGKDIDVSNDVETGFTEITLQGKTYQNLVNDKQWLRKETSIVSSHTNNVGLLSIGWYESDIQLLKPNTIYTFIMNVEISENTLENSYCQLNYTRTTGGQNGLFTLSKSLFHKGGILVYKFTTPADFLMLAQFFIGGYGGSLSIKSKGMYIFEGDHTNIYYNEFKEYFVGIKSSFENGIVDIECENKNLFKIQVPEYYTGWGSYNVKINKFGFTFDSNNGWNKVGFYYPKLANKTVTVSAKVTFRTKKGSPSSVQSFGISNKTGWHWIESRINEKEYSDVCCTMKLDETGLVSFFGGCNKEGIENIVEWDLENIQIEENCEQTKYEPYNKQNYLFNIKESLRSLPNGICDEIRNNNGQWELIRRVGKITLNGNENWLNATGFPTLFYYNVTNIGNANIYVKENIIPNIMCDIMPIVSYSDAKLSGENMLCITNRGNSSSHSVAINIPTSKGSIKQWLSENPTSIYYELEVPIVIPIDPIKFNIGFLSTANINSEIAPASTHKVVLNRAGQIEQSIIQIADLKARIDELETVYNSSLLESQYKIDNLRLNYELDKEED